MVMPVNVPQVAVKGLEEAITSKNCIKLQLRLEESGLLLHGPLFYGRWCLGGGEGKILIA